MTRAMTMAAPYAARMRVSATVIPPFRPHDEGDGDDRVHGGDGDEDHAAPPFRYSCTAWVTADTATMAKNTRSHAGWSTRNSALLASQPAQNRFASD